MGDVVKVFALLATVMFAMALVVGCISSSDPVKQVGKTTEVCSPVDYDNGVLFFPCVRAEYGNSVSRWLERHPAYYVTGVTGEGATGYGGDTGYWVFTEKR